MARVCEICGKGPQVGNQVTIRGKAKYLGGVGTKVTGITKRTFKPNLQRLRVTVRGTNTTQLVCTQCIKSGAVTKLVRRKPFKLSGADGAKQIASKSAAPKSGAAKNDGAKADARASPVAKAPAKKGPAKADGKGPATGKK